MTDKDRIKELLDLPLQPEGTYEPLIFSEADFRRLDTAYMSLMDRSPQDNRALNVDGLPANDADRVKLVGLLTNAMRSMRKASDAFKTESG